MDLAQQVLVVVTAVDVLAVATLGWLVARGARLRDLAPADQRRALADLKGELAQLLHDAEARARTLEAALGASQEWPPARAGRVRTLTPEDEAPVAGGSRLGVDPAEARLIRDLEVSFQRGRTA
jgi:hypothetical protein